MNRMMSAVVGLCAVGMLAAGGTWAATADAAGGLVKGEGGSGVTISTSGDGSTVVSFAARPAGARQAFLGGAAVADVGVASGAFVGNYKAAGITGLSFQFMTDGHKPLSLALFLNSADGRTWVNNKLQVSDVANVWAMNNVALTRAAGWDAVVGPGKDKDALWDKALKSVKAIGLAVAANGEEAQTYVIKDFVLAGPNGFTAPANLTALQRALMAKFGVTRIGDVGSAGAAGNGNGMTALDATLAGTDSFMAEIVKADADGVTVKWSSAVEWMNYKVMRTKALTDPFVEIKTVTTASPEVTVADGEMIWTDTSVTADDGPFFYKVVGQVVE